MTHEPEAVCDTCFFKVPESFMVHHTNWAGQSFHYCKFCQALEIESMVEQAADTTLMASGLTYGEECLRDPEFYAGLQSFQNVPVVTSYPAGVTRQSR